ncbi:protein phosphatase 1 regulatory subunit 1B-like isoform X1 [Brienomyrus brachyistius]|uniref:protein phosphatase 1 regulatory subunit 1B-like isoform X1 n=1 Tax=Brienomyrus brachyistius TaxID=42636 RepID=UPI0020B1B575|nr:protein phosphatase 1 regulatory subunit 1B-like isoform X1 [Brienomyrus brachyistius]
MEPNNPKKIQFAVPPHQKQLDPQAAEQIRRRRPTPASLMVYANPEAGDTGDKRETGYLGEVPSSELSRAQRKHGVYTAPTMRGTALTTTSSTSLIVGSGGLCQETGGVKQHPLSQVGLGARPKERVGALPRCKDTPYQHHLHALTGGKLLKTDTKLSFPEEEEDDVCA